MVVRCESVSITCLLSSYPLFWMPSSVSIYSLLLLQKFKFIISFTLRQIFLLRYKACRFYPFCSVTTFLLMPWLLIFLCCIVRNFWCHNRENWRVFSFCCDPEFMKATNCLRWYFHSRLPGFPVFLTGRLRFIQTPILLWVRHKENNIPANHHNHTWAIHPSACFRLRFGRWLLKQAIGNLHKTSLSHCIRFQFSGIDL